MSMFSTGVGGMHISSAYRIPLSAKETVYFKNIFIPSLSIVLEGLESEIHSKYALTSLK